MNDNGFNSGIDSCLKVGFSYAITHWKDLHEPDGDIPDAGTLPTE